VALCELRGEVTIVGLHDAPIPWPVGKKRGQRVRVLILGAASWVIAKRDNPGLASRGAA
jgi:hypothetical protein